MRLRYAFRQRHYMPLFRLWRSQNIRRHISKVSIFRKLFSYESADLSLGFCLGTVYFIAKMLYSKQSGGGLMYAQEFVRTLYGPMIHKDDAALMLRSYYVVQNYTDVGKEVSLDQRMRQLYAEYDAAFATLAQYETLAPARLLDRTLVYAELKRSAIFHDFLYIPSSFWFYNEHLFQTLTHPMRCVLFPFVAEIMDIQERFYRNLHITVDRSEIARELFVHSLSKVIVCPPDKFIMEEIKSKLLDIKGVIHVTHPMIDLERRLNEQIGALSHRSLTPHTCTLNADRIYQVNYFVNLAAVGGEVPALAHAICGWEVEELIGERHVIRTFLFDANLGLCELSYTEGEREKFGTELIDYWKRGYLIPHGRTSCFLTCTFYSGVRD